MNTEEWARLLAPWAAGAVRRIGDQPTPGPLSGLGQPGVSAAILEVAEQRLGAILPPSYRSFLECTNGLRQPSDSVAARGGDFWPAEEIDWFRARNQSWIDAYADLSADVPDELYFVYGSGQDPARFRSEYLNDCLQISDDGDSAVYLLNPRIIDPTGEWEAWFFSNWNPGAFRYRSFADLMRAHYEEFQSSNLDGF